MRLFAFLAGMLLFAPSTFADERQSIDTWVFPEAKLKERSSTPVAVTSADKTNVQSVANGSFQYITEKPFHEVVLYYARKCGLKPTNKSILARPFPGTTIYMPAHFSRSNFYRETASVSALHYIRENVASAQFLVTDHPELGFIAISVTRGKNDDQTLIQLIHHTATQITRGGEPADAPTDRVSRFENGNSNAGPR